MTVKASGLNRRRRGAGSAKALDERWADRFFGVGVLDELRYQSEEHPEGLDDVIADAYRCLRQTRAMVADTPDEEAAVELCHRTLRVWGIEPGNLNFYEPGDGRAFLEVVSAVADF